MVHRVVSLPTRVDHSPRNARPGRGLHGSKRAPITGWKGPIERGFHVGVKKASHQKKARQRTKGADRDELAGE